jgi:hypothetical protein
MNGPQAAADTLQASAENSATSKSPRSFEDVLIPDSGNDHVPDTRGGQRVQRRPKIGVATLAGATLWALTTQRSDENNRVASALRQHRRWTILGLACVTLLALTITVIAYGRPTPTTVTVSTLTLSVLSAAAAAGHRVPAAMAAALSGGTLGLCAGIALL